MRGVLLSSSWTMNVVRECVWVKCDVVLLNFLSSLEIVIFNRWCNIGPVRIFQSGVRNPESGGFSRIFRLSQAPVIIIIVVQGLL